MLSGLPLSRPHSHPSKLSQTRPHTMPAAPQTFKTSLISGLQFRMLGAVALLAVAAVGGAGDVGSSAPASTVFSAESNGSEAIAALTVAPKTWSSRSQVRWDARFGSNGCYVV